MASVYSRAEGNGELQKSWFDDNFFIDKTALYINKEKAAKFYQSAGVQFPLEGRKFNDLFGSSVKTEEDLVKLKNQNTAMYQESDRTTKGSIASDPQVQGRKIISIWRLPTNPPL